MPRIRSSLAASLLLLCAPAIAQPDDSAIGPNRPTALTQPVRALAEVARIDLEALDLAAVAQEDVKRELDGLAPRYAVPVRVVIDTQTGGTWEDLDERTRLWRLRVAAPGASSLNLGFTRYVMPPGGRLVIHASDFSEIVRPFTDADNEVHGQLWTPVVRSDDIVVELTIPAAAVPALELELTHVGHGYRGFGAPVDPLLSGSCNVDTICAEGDDWRAEIGAVAVISTGGSTFCTGFMVNNTANDLTPYFMTANHCGVGAGNAASLVAYWNYENSWCRAPGSVPSGQPGDGSLSQFNTGSFHRASYSSSDFTLVELDEVPDPEWQVGLAGWDRSGVDTPGAVGIHHPGTDEKRISFEDDPTVTTSYLGDGIPGDGTHVRVQDWDLGTTEPGSSGSPLFDLDHRVIGQLHGGYAACGNELADWYGRLSVSWSGGGTPATRLSDWLDPGGTGALVVDTISGAGLLLTPSGTVEHIGVVGGPFTNQSVTYTLSNPTPANIDYTVALTASFGVLLDGGTAPITGTLAALGGTRDVVVSLGPDIDALAAGVFVEDVTIDDVTNALTRVRRHIVEVGQTLLAVDPLDDLETGGPVGGPFTGTIEYTVTSERPTPVLVEVAASQPWIALDGGAAPVTFELDGTGAFRTVTIGFSAEAETLTAGLYEGSVSFTNLSGGGGAASRAIVLDVGRLVHHAADTPISILDNQTSISTISVPDDVCIGDVDVDIDITHTYIGDLVVELTSPQGTTVRLHDRSGGSADDIVARYDDEGFQPDGPGLLSDFDLEQSGGTWTLRVTDNAGADQGMMNDWSLRIAAFAGDCPTPELVHEFPLDTDPGWTTQGEWAWGAPTGGGGEYGNPDPSTGATGPNVYGYDLNGDYENGIGELHLTSAPIDCSNLSFVRMKFWRWLNVETSTYDRATVRVSTDGTSWTTVWENTSQITDSAWSQRSFDISALADGASTVYLRWTMGPTDSSWRFSGWNIDDVEIWGVPGDCPADIDGNLVVDFQDLLVLLSAWGPCAGCPADLNGNGIIDFQDLLTLLSGWGACP